MSFSRRQFFAVAGLALLPSCARVRETAAKAEQLKPNLHLWGGKGPLTFATIGDLHVTDAKSTAIVRRAVAAMNAREHLGFTAVLGDLGSNGTIQEMGLSKATFAGLERPAFVIPGNHDLTPNARDEYANYRGAFGDTEWRQEEDGWAFLGLDTCNGTASNVTVPAERMDWLARQLKHIPAKRNIALFTHHPFNPHTKYRVGNADEVLALFGNHRLRLVASGHFHGNQEEERDGILFVTTACCSSTRNNHDGTSAKGFRVFRIDGGVIGHEFVEVPA